MIRRSPDKIEELKADCILQQAERMWVSSCIFSNDYSSLVAVCFSDVRLQLNFDSLLEESGDPEDDRESESSQTANTQDSRGKLPSNIITALKVSDGSMPFGARGSGFELLKTFIAKY